MAKANFQLPDGTIITIDGTDTEIKNILSIYQGKLGTKKTSKKTVKQANVKKPKKEGPANLIRELIKEDFFKVKRGIQQVKTKLEEKGKIYDITVLSTPLIRLVRNKELRRLKEKDIWVYVNY